MIWSPDTCDCKLEINNEWNWISTIQGCRLHHGLKGQNLVDTVMAQNRRFNQAFGLELTENQKEIISTAKELNKLRIQNEPTKTNPNFDEHLPYEKPLTFFQNLRKKLRL